MELKTTNIKGKDYVEVNERLKAFRLTANYLGWSLTSEIKEFTPDYVLIQAHIVDQNGREIANGLAYETRDSSLINKTSFVENCETSAWGRALGNLGIGIDSAICSAQELTYALAGQGAQNAPAAPEKNTRPKNTPKAAPKAVKEDEKAVTPEQKNQDNELIKLKIAAAKAYAVANAKFGEWLVGQLHMPLEKMTDKMWFDAYDVLIKNNKITEVKLENKQ